MAIGLSKSKNLSESNLNLKTALQKLYSPGVEVDLELFSLSSSIESIIFSGLDEDENSQVYRLTSESLNTISGGVVKRTKFNTSYLTFTDENKVFFTEYTADTGNSSSVTPVRFSSGGSVPALRLVTGGGGFYLLNAQNNLVDLELFSASWSASSSSTITVNLASHGFEIGQILEIRFNNSGGGTNATSGEYTVASIQPNSFTIVNSGGSITGSGQASVRSYDIRLSNVGFSGKISGATNLRADVTLSKLSFDYLPGVSATYTNTSFGTQLGSTAATTITLNNHGFTTGSSVYIRAITGTLQSGFVSSVVVANANTFTVILPVSSANTNQTCQVCYVDELVRFTPGNASRYFIKSVTVTDSGSNYVIPENLEVIESNVTNSNNSETLKIVRQRGPLFGAMNEIIRTEQFVYSVKNSTEEGFFLYDDEKRQYLFLDKETSVTGLTESQKIQLRRFDGVDIANILQFKFARSLIYIRSYGYAFGLGDSISGAINRSGSAASRLKERTSDSIQNTKRPTPATSDENTLGYTYNKFIGNDVVIWQRLVLRDQDYVLNPNDTTFGTGAITGDRLKTAVQGFVMGPIVSWSSTTAGVATITLSGHSVKTGDIVTVSGITTSSGVAFSSGNYTATYVNASSFSIVVNTLVASSGTLSLGLSDPNFQIRVPGLFIKVGSEYRRAFSTTDKPFAKRITDSAGVGVYANPTMSGSGVSFTSQSFGALSAEDATVDNNPTLTNWYSYNSTISELAQRIHPGGVNGAFYFHRSTTPSVTELTGLGANVFSVPLFTLG